MYVSEKIYIYIYIYMYYFYTYIYIYIYMYYFFFLKKIMTFNIGNIIVYNIYYFELLMKFKYKGNKI